jgi:hypothetical protein
LGWALDLDSRLFLGKMQLATLVAFCPKKVSNQEPGPTPRNALARIKHFTHGAV